MKIRLHRKKAKNLDQKTASTDKHKYSLDIFSKFSTNIRNTSTLKDVPSPQTSVNNNSNNCGFTGDKKNGTKVTDLNSLVLTGGTTIRTSSEDEGNYSCDGEIECTEWLSNLHIGPPSIDDPLDFDLPPPIGQSDDNSIVSGSASISPSSSPSAEPTEDNEDVESSFVDEIEEDCTSLASSTRDCISPGGITRLGDISSIGISADWPPTASAAAAMVAMDAETMALVDINNNPYVYPQQFRQRSASFSGSSDLKRAIKYNRPSWARPPRPLNLNYNSNFKRPPETWLRSRYPGHHHQTYHHLTYNRHTTPFYSYTYSKTSWAYWAFRYASRGRKPHKGLLTNFLPCLCCGCCNCARVNQTYCCCCYHCVHRISACRRPDLSRMRPTVSTKSISSAIAPAPPSHPPPPPPVITKVTPESETESGLDSGTDSPIRRESRKCSAISSLSGDCNSLRF
ncbi:uncharacterized protein LOC141856423 [Brevipalpus obovatus]|uniref:uncharacterized protein LOC141856423 n=1 Tax=Brevipalpus obovatus TaxID=246614 RepID=UPI003D9DC33C